MVGRDASHRGRRRPSPALTFPVISGGRHAHDAPEAIICYCIPGTSERERMHMRFEAGTKSVLFALAALLLAVLSAEPAATLYPDRIIRIVVPFAAGGGTDVIARTLAQEMAKDLGVSVIIENKPGAGTIIGTQAVAASEPDGYTLLMATFSHAVNISLSAKLPYDPHSDFTPVALV